MHRSFLFVFIIFLLSFFLTTQNCIAVSSDVIKFSDPVVESICVSNWDRNYDRKLSYSEAELVTDLENVFTSSSISYFNELQYFTGLESISFNAFGECHELNELTLPNSIVEIEGYAFYKCYSLQHIYLNEGLIRIYDHAFNDCRSLLSVKIPDSVTVIGGFAFYNCCGLKDISIGVGVQKIGEKAFAECTGNLIINCNIPDSEPTTGNPFMFAKFSSINFGDNVERIGNYAFYCSHLRCRIDLGKNIKEIGAYAFYSWKHIVNLVIPDNITDIGECAFTKCTNLQNIKFGTGLERIGNSAFMDCEKIVSIDLPASLLSIGSSAFYRCIGLQSVTMGDNLTDVGQLAFCQCTNLKNVQLGKAVKNISRVSFQGCTSLKSLTIPDSVLTIGEQAFYGCTGLEDVVIGDGVMSIGDDAFMQCMYIKKLKIGKNIRKLGRQVFVDCASVDELELGSLVDIGAHALPKHIGHLVININVIEPYIIKNIMGAAQVSSVEIGENVSEIGDYAFKGYSLKKFKIGKNVKRIGEEAFFNCGNLGHIELPSNIQYIGPRAFGRTSGYLTIGCNLPDYDTFLDSPFNGAYLSSINIGNSVSKIGKYSLSSIGGTIKEISIGSNVKELGQFAFRSTKSMRLLIYCDLPDLESQSYGPFYQTTLDEIVFAQRVSRLGCNLFDYSGVKKIIIESNLNEIGSDTFKGFQGDLIIKSNVPDYYKPEDSPFYGLKVHSIEFGTWVNSIGENAFNNTSCQEQLKLLSTLTNIGERAFMGFDGTLYLNYNTLDSEKSSASPFYKSKFREVKVGNSVTKIGSYAFYDCVELKKVEIGKKVQVFGQEAFGGRTNLEQIYLHCDNPPILESDALGVNSTLQIYVPINSVKAYKKSWKKQRKYVVPINTSLSY